MSGSVYDVLTLCKNQVLCDCLKQPKTSFFRKYSLLEDPHMGANVLYITIDA